MPTVLPPSFRRKQLGRHIRFASRVVAGRTSPSTLAHMPYVRIHPRSGNPFPLLIRLLYVLLVYERESTGRHSSTAKTIKMKPEKLGRQPKNPSPHEIIFCLIGTPCTGQKMKKIVQQSFYLSLVSRPPLSRPPRHRFGQFSLLSVTVSPVPRLALSPVLTVAVVRQLDNVVIQTGYLPL